MGENQIENDIVRTSERYEQIGDDSDETISNVAVNVETLDEEAQLIIENTLNRTTAKVNRMSELIETKNIAQTNNLIKAAVVWVAYQLGFKKYEAEKKKDPCWKIRIEEDIKQLKKDINILERVKKGKIGARKEAKLVEKKYGVKRKGPTTVTEELKQRILAKAAKKSRYEERIQQYRINGLFKVDQKKVYNEFNGQTGSCNGHIPNAEESRSFWSGIWSVEKKAKCLSDLKEEMVKLEQQNVEINEDKVKKQCSKMRNWKAPGHDGVQGFWIIRLDKMHKRITTQLNETKEIPSWVMYGRTVLCQRDPVKANSVEKFRPIICLPLM